MRVHISYACYRTNYADADQIAAYVQCASASLKLLWRCRDDSFRPPPPLHEDVANLLMPSIISIEFVALRPTWLGWKLCVGALETSSDHLYSSQSTLSLIHLVQLMLLLSK